MADWVRRCLTVACLMAVWLVAHGAEAAAPVCDARGMSAIAPAPVLEVSDASLTVSPAQDCDAESDGSTIAHRGGKPSRNHVAAQAELMLPAPLSWVSAFVGGAEPASESVGAPRLGVVSQVERPPR